MSNFKCFQDFFVRLTLGLNLRVVFSVKRKEDERERKFSQNELYEGYVKDSVNIL